jgi:hypothetical protein
MAMTNGKAATRREGEQLDMGISVLEFFLARSI